jgi:diguanylate cyclase (GGDEF)-like protein
VLRSVAQTLVAASRVTDFVARFGGDEFVVVLPDSGEAGVELVSRRVKEILRDTPPGPVPFTVSIGSAVVDPVDPQKFEDLMAAADEAMYEDKQRAREAAKAAGLAVH